MCMQRPAGHAVPWRRGGSCEAHSGRSGARWSLRVCLRDSGNNRWNILHRNFDRVTNGATGILLVTVISFFVSLLKTLWGPGLELFKSGIISLLIQFPKQLLWRFENSKLSTTFILVFDHCCVADPDPRSGAFLTPGSGMRIRDEKKSRAWIRDEHPASYFWELCISFLG